MDREKKKKIRRRVIAGVLSNLPSSPLSFCSTHPAAFRYPRSAVPDEAEIKLANDRETLLNLQIQTQYNGYEEGYNKEVRDLQRQAKDVEELIASYKEYQAEMKSQKASSESGVLDAGGKAKLEADTVPS